MDAIAQRQNGYYRIAKLFFLLGFAIAPAYDEVKAEDEICVKRLRSIVR